MLVTPLFSGVEMNIFMAAVHTNGYKHPSTARFQKLNDHERNVVNQLPHLLESYHYIHKETYVNHIRESGDKIFLDSGAFSAWTLGVDIDLPTYCDYIKRNMDILRIEDGDVMASVLDGIGDVHKTYENQLAMEALGAKPLPCFHFEEDERYLEWYIANYQYITLGGMVGKPVKQLRNWLDRIWDRYLCDGSGRAKIKVHAFGITSVEIMERYPWYSVDSSSWIQAAAFGSVITPDHGPMPVSDKSPSRHDAGRHVSNFSPAEKQYVFDMFQKQGFDYERLSTVYESRAAYNLWSFMQVNDHINKVNAGQFANEVQELF